MQRDTRSHPIPHLQSASSDLEHLLRKAGTTEPSDTASSKSIHIAERLKEIQDAIQREFDALKGDVLPQEIEEPTNKQDSDLEHNPLSMMWMVGAEVK